MVEPDRESWIFQVGMDGAKVKENRIVRNRGLGYSRPCFIHFAGGYTDPVTGKADQIEPIWKELGYEC
jgi:hypothetical protein